MKQLWSDSSVSKCLSNLAPLQMLSPSTAISCSSLVCLVCVCVCVSDTLSVLLSVLCWSNFFFVVHPLVFQFQLNFINSFKLISKRYFTTKLFLYQLLAFRCLELKNVFFSSQYSTVNRFFFPKMRATHFSCFCFKSSKPSENVHQKLWWIIQVFSSVSQAVFSKHLFRLKQLEGNF